MISTTYTPTSYNCDGIVDEFPFSWDITADTDIIITETVIATGVETVKAIGTHYTVTGLGPGTVTAATPPPSTVRWTLSRLVPRTQAADYVEHDSFPADTHEDAIDKLTMISQEQDAIFTRTLRQPVGDVDDLDSLPSKVDRASKYLAFDADGNPVATAGTENAFVVSSFAETFLDDASEAAARITLDAAERGWEIQNLTLTATVGSNALTVALKTAANNDPTALDPIKIRFADSTAGAQGTYTWVTITAALSVTVSSGSTLGTVSAVANRLYIGIANDGGTPRLFVYNPTKSSGGPVVLFLDDIAKYSSTAEGGAGAADSAQVLYSTAAFTTKHIRILGYVESTQATAGTWATSPSKTILLSHLDPSPIRFDQPVTGTWAPLISASVIGNLNVLFSTREGTWVKVGKLVIASFNLLTSTFTHTTASGDIIITGLPFTVDATVVHVGSLYFSGLTKANYTQFISLAMPGTTTIELQASAQAQTGTAVAITDFPTAGTVVLYGTVSYIATA